MELYASKFEVLCFKTPRGVLYFGVFSTLTRVLHKSGGEGAYPDPPIQKKTARKRRNFLAELQKMSKILRFQVFPRIWQKQIIKKHESAGAKQTLLVPGGSPDPPSALRGGLDPPPSRPVQDQRSLNTLTPTPPRLTASPQHVQEGESRQGESAIDALGRGNFLDFFVSQNWETATLK